MGWNRMGVWEMGLARAEASCAELCCESHVRYEISVMNIMKSESINF
jgi:hypothetical protein